MTKQETYAEDIPTIDDIIKDKGEIFTIDEIDCSSTEDFKDALQDICLLNETD